MQTLYVSVQYVPGGKKLDDDLSGWHVCKDRKNSSKKYYWPCFWDGRNDEIIIPNADAEFYKVTEESSVRQLKTDDGKWFILKVEDNYG